VDRYSGYLYAALKQGVGYLFSVVLQLGGWARG